MKPTLKALETKPLKLKYDELLSIFAFNFDLRRYKLGEQAAGVMSIRYKINQRIDWVAFERFIARMAPEVWRCSLTLSTTR